MNKGNNQIIYDTFVDVIEWLEKYVEKANYYSDWSERKQIHISTITRSDIDTMEAVKVRRDFLVSLKCLKTMLGFRENKSFPKEELKKQFFQWIAAAKIISNNCPADLGLLLYHFHEVLEGRGEKFSQQTSKEADKNISKMSKEEREKGWRDFHSAVIEQYQKGGETEKREFSPNGNAKQGQETFEKIVATISNYDLFPEEEIATDNSPEAQTAIKELEEILDQAKPDIKNDPELLEKTIQGLDDFEKNNENNSGKNNYAWVKLGGGGKLIELKIIKLNQEGKLCPVKPNLQTSSDNSRFFPTIAVILIPSFFILSIIVYAVRKKKNK